MMSSTLVSLSIEQARDLNFPVGCPVWYNFSQSLGVVHQGIVKAVSLDIIHKKISYSVARNNDEQGDDDGQLKLDTVAEEDIAYAAGCPVFISSDSPRIRQDGEVIYAKLGENKEGNGDVTYIVKISEEGHAFRIEEGVNASRLQYREGGLSTIHHNDNDGTDGTKLRKQSSSSNARSGIASLPQLPLTLSEEESNDGEQKQQRDTKSAQRDTKSVRQGGVSGSSVEQDKNNPKAQQKVQKKQGFGNHNGSSLNSSKFIHKGKSENNVQLGKQQGKRKYHNGPRRNSNAQKKQIVRNPSNQVIMNRGQNAGYNRNLPDWHNKEMTIEDHTNRTNACEPSPLPPSEHDPPLPMGWERAVDLSSGRTYYANRSTRETSWEVPTFKHDHGSAFDPPHSAYENDGAI